MIIPRQENTVIVSMFVIIAIATQALAENRKSWIGMRFTDNAEYKGIKKDKGLGIQGLFVVDVVPEGPAYIAGIRVG